MEREPWKTGLSEADIESRGVQAVRMSADDGLKDREAPDHLADTVLNLARIRKSMKTS